MTERTISVVIGKGENLSGFQQRTQEFLKRFMNIWTTPIFETITSLGTTLNSGKYSGIRLESIKLSQLDTVEKILKSLVKTLGEKSVIEQVEGEFGPEFQVLFTPDTETESFINFYIATTAHTLGMAVDFDLPGF